MNLKCFVFFVILIGFATNTSQSFAMCTVNEDWPNAPCMDMIINGHYPQEQVDRWANYYDYKGSEFMETKKQEMNQALQNNRLQQWVEESNQNYNVWTYYHFSGEVQRVSPYHTAGFELITRDKTHFQNLISIHNPFWHDPEIWFLTGILGGVMGVISIIMWRKRK